jgi:hypothetical protein
MQVISSEGAVLGSGTVRVTGSAPEPTPSATTTTPTAPETAQPLAPKATASTTDEQE